MVYVHLAEGFEEIEVTTIVDILRRGEIETRTVSIGEKRVVGAHGVPITADLVYEDADYSTCDMIVLPGGIPGTTNLQEHKGLRESILAFSGVNRWIAAICAAPMISRQRGLDEIRPDEPGPAGHKKLHASILTGGRVRAGRDLSRHRCGPAARPSLASVPEMPQQESDRGDLKLGRRLQ